MSYLIAWSALIFLKLSSGAGQGKRQFPGGAALQSAECMLFSKFKYRANMSEKTRNDRVKDEPAIRQIREGRDRQ